VSVIKICGANICMDSDNGVLFLLSKPNISVLFLFLQSPNMRE